MLHPLPRDEEDVHEEELEEELRAVSAGQDSKTTVLVVVLKMKLGILTLHGIASSFSLREACWQRHSNCCENSASRYHDLKVYDQYTEDLESVDLCWL